MIHQSHDLKTLRETASRALLTVLWLHVPICLTIGLMRGGEWLLPVILTVAMAGAATLSWRATGNELFDSPGICRGADGGCFGLHLPTHRSRLADRHAYVFLCGAGLPGRLLRLPADRRRYNCRRIASPGAEFSAACGDLSRWGRFRTRRVSRRYPDHRGRGLDLAGRHVGYTVRD